MQIYFELQISLYNCNFISTIANLFFTAATWLLFVKDKDEEFEELERQFSQLSSCLSTFLFNAQKVQESNQFWAKCGCWIFSQIFFLFGQPCAGREDHDWSF